MFQYLLLAALAIYVAALALDLTAAREISIVAASSALGEDWWNPFLLGGLMGALVFLVALLPGWVAEQDPWQKIWAARDEKAAKRGLFLEGPSGAGLPLLLYHRHRPLCALPPPGGRGGGGDALSAAYKRQCISGTSGPAFHRLCRCVHVLHRYLRHLRRLLHLP